MTRLILLPLLLILGIGSTILHAQETYGTGAPGAGFFVPEIRCNQAWMGRPDFAVDVDFGLSGATVYLLISTAPAQLPLGGAAELLVNPNSLLLVDSQVLSGPAGSAGSGSASWTLPLSFAALPGLAGLSIYAQALVVDGSQGPVALSSGLDIRFAMPPEIFVGTSIAGSTDAWFLANPQSGSLSSNGAGPLDNCDGAIFADDGLTLYTASGISGVLHSVDVSDVTAPVWTTVATTPSNLTGLAHDPERDLLWTISELNGVNELIAYDADPTSPSYGSLVANTFGLGSVVGLIGTFAMSPDGRRAAIPSLLGGFLFVFDTDPLSPTYLQQIVFVPIPISGSSAFWANAAIAFSEDGDQVIIARQAVAAVPAEIARYSFGLGAWVDHNSLLPGTQNLGAAANPPVPLGSAPSSLSVSQRNGIFAICGFGGGGTPGWAGIIRYDPANPFSYAYRAVSGSALDNSWNCALDADGRRLAITDSSPLELKIFDATTGIFGFSISLAGNSSGRGFAWR